MTETAAATALRRLDALERTGWLDAGCRAVESTRARRMFDDPFAQWMIEKFGQAPGYRGLHSSLRLGVTARTWRVDEAICRQLQRARRAGTAIEVWSLGAGFDARRLRLARVFDGVVTAYREFDLPGVLDAKAVLIRESPFARDYGELNFLPVDRPEALPAVLPEAKGLVLVVAEGLMDFLPLAVRVKLLNRLGCCAPCSVLLLDALSRRGTDFDNRQPHRYTGDARLRMEDAPDDPSIFHAEAGWVAIDRSSLFSAMRDVLVHRHPWMLTLVGKLSLPHSMRHIYELHTLEPAGAALSRDGEDAR